MGRRVGQGEGDLECAIPAAGRADDGVRLEAGRAVGMDQLGRPDRHLHTICQSDEHLRHRDRVADLALGYDPGQTCILECQRHRWEERLLVDDEDDRLGWCGVQRFNPIARLGVETSGISLSYPGRWYETRLVTPALSRGTDRPGDEHSV